MSDVAKNQTGRRVIEKDDLIAQLRQLGLEEGDTVLVRADFGKLGRIRKPADRLFVASLLEVVGKRGTLLCLTHSPCQFYFRRDKSYVYEPRTAPCLTGRFAETMLAWDGVFRSSHPTCSMSAVGANANEILHDHDHTSSCFAPIRRLIEARGKLLLAGCTSTSPGFSTVHYAYEHLGLASSSWLSGWLGCYFKIGERAAWFRQRDVPGCSLGFHKFYAMYKTQSLLQSGLIGQGESFLIRADQAFAVEKEAIARDPKCSLCANPDCYSCRATKRFNLGDLPRYLWNHGPRLLARVLGKRRPS